MDNGKFNDSFGSISESYRFADMETAMSLDTIY